MENPVLGEEPAAWAWIGHWIMSIVNTMDKHTSQDHKTGFAEFSQSNYFVA
jgi:hypothetical protein